MYFKQKSIASKYFNHPPHITFYTIVINECDLFNVKEEFKDLVNNLKKINVKLHNWKIFENDILTGLNTLCLEIKLTDSLYAMQLSIVNKLLDFNLKTPNFNYVGDFKKSYVKYGYPFVGENWIPHITIGSMNLETFKIKNEVEGKIIFQDNIKIDNLSLFEINDDDHKLIEKIFLNGDS